MCRATDYFLCKFKPGMIIFPFRINEERIVVLSFGLTTNPKPLIRPQTNRAFYWQVGQFNYYTVDKFGSGGWSNANNRNFNLEYNETDFFSTTKPTGYQSCFVHSKTYVDQIEVDTLKEFANSPQAKAFRRVVFSILYDLPQSHLFQSYLRSRGFDVSICKEKYCNEVWKGTPFEHSVVFNWNVWDNAPKEDWLQSLWSKLH